MASKARNEPRAYSLIKELTLGFIKLCTPLHQNVMLQKKKTCLIKLIESSKWRMSLHQMKMRDGGDKIRPRRRSISEYEKFLM